MTWHSKMVELARALLEAMDLCPGRGRVGAHLVSATIGVGTASSPLECGCVWLRGRGRPRPSAIRSQVVLSGYARRVGMLSLVLASGLLLGQPKSQQPTLEHLCERFHFVSPLFFDKVRDKVEDKVSQSHVVRFRAAAEAGATCLSPSALTFTKDGQTLFVACATTDCVLRVDAASRTVLESIRLPAAPSGLALSADERQLFVTCAGPESKVCMVALGPESAQPNRDPIDGGAKITNIIPAGHTALAPVLSPDGKWLYVCNRFNHDVSVIDLAARSEVNRIAVRREPVAAALTRDGRYLLVANHLQSGRADGERVAAVVSVIDLVTDQVIRELLLPSGSGVVQGIAISPNGRYAVLTHLVAGFTRETSQVTLGWINANALTIIDLARMTLLSTVLLDEPDNGAANPWGVAWSADSATLVVAHAGTHEVSVIDFARLLTAVREAQPESTAASSAQPGRRFRSEAAERVLAFVTRYYGYLEGLPFLVGARQRIPLPQGDLGPRAVLLTGKTAYVANYFSDSLSVIDLSVCPLKAESIPLGPKPEMNPVRQGEFYFHDAKLCLQQWQSCASCHPGEGRMDGLNWDLLNDGIGNPKNTRSLLFAHQTPPAMSLGVRERAETAVRAGIRHILFAEPSEEVASAIDAYLKSLKPVPSPYLEGGRLSPMAERGKQVFVRAGCADCHPAPLLTDLQRYDVGTRRAFDKPADEFDTPSLVELWRTAPYLHDGSAVTVRDVVTAHNPHDQHGDTSRLSSQEIDELCAYLLSL